MWDEWDGRGRDDAVAFAYGTWRRDSLDDAMKRIRQLGLEAPDGHALDLAYGYIGNVGGDHVPDVCDAAGSTLDGSGEQVDGGTVRAVTFAVYSLLDE
jgi:hypothetical protein